MRHLEISAVFACLLLCTAAAQTSNNTSSYSIRPSDGLKITVVGEPEMTVSLDVPTDGSIIFPLVGSLRVAGLTARDLQRMLAEKLSPFIRHPLVNVEIRITHQQPAYPLREPYPVGMVRVQ